nr:LapA family protein [Anoxybacillus sp. ST70]
MLVALFSISNVQNVEVNYIVGYFETPLVIVILSSVMLGALIVFFVGGLKLVKMRNYTKKLEKEIERLETALTKKEVALEIEQACSEEEKEASL